MDASGTVKQVNNYYPSGTTMAESPRRTDQDFQPYKFTSKELDRFDTMNFYDFEARTYDPTLMRFTGMDPLAEKYPSISPYVYALNNPVKYIDPDGRDAMLAGRGTKDDPYVITAVYYYQNGSLDNVQVKGLNDAVAAYNNSGKNGVTEIKNNDGSKSYVSYNLSAQGVDNPGEERIANTGFEATSGDTRYYGNIVGTEPYTGKEMGSANNIRIDFNVDNINAGIASGMNSSSLNKGVAIHEIGHNLGGEHSDGTSVMNIVGTTETFHQIGGQTTVSHSYPSMSTKFTPIIFNRRDTPFSTTGNIWTKKP